MKSNKLFEFLGDRKTTFNVSTIAFVCLFISFLRLFFTNKIISPILAAIVIIGFVGDATFIIYRFIKYHQSSTNK